MPVYFIRSEQVDGKVVRIGGPLAHHLKDVLRCRVGEVVVLVDERRRRYTTRVTATTAAEMACAIYQEETPPPAALRSLSLGLACLKGERMDWALQKATEMGVTRIAPLITARTVARPVASRQTHQHARWMGTVIEAAQQVGRWEVPSIAPPQTLATFLDGAHSGFKLLFWEEADPADCHSVIRPSVAAAPRAGTVLIGPEGGWEASEVDAAIAAGFRVASLGPRILRAETAALAALSVLQYEMDNLPQEG